MPPSCCPAAPAAAGADDDEEVAALPTGAGDGGDTDLTVSVVELEPTVDVARGIFADLGGGAGEYRLAAFAIDGVAGAAAGGAEITEPCAWVLPMLEMVGVPGTPVPSTGVVESAWFGAPGFAAPAIIPGIAVLIGGTAPRLPAAAAPGIA